MFSSWALVAIVAILAGTISSYLQNKNKTADKRKNDISLQSLDNQLERLTKRVQNLEAIAANDPDGFKAKKKSAEYDINFDDSEIMDDIENETEEQPKQRVSELANQLKKRQHD